MTIQDIVTCTDIRMLKQRTSIIEGTDNTISTSAARVAAINFGALRISKRPVGLSKATAAPDAIWNEGNQNEKGCEREENLTAETRKSCPITWNMGRPCMDMTLPPISCSPNHGDR
jgi:hypothetical protein